MKDVLEECAQKLVEMANVLRSITEKPPTFIEIRKAFSEKASAGFTEEIKALLSKYGASKLSEVAAEDYNSIMTDLEALQ